MDLELLIHGVPDGQDYYGITEEQTNVGLFYDSSAESVKFVIEAKKHGNKAFAYYSYLRYKGMIGAGGRSGSYFGLTLRIDEYYQDALHIYSLLDILFKRYIVGTLLTPSGEGYKYIVPHFATKAAEIEKAQQALIQLIQTCVPAKFMGIDSSFIHPNTSVANGNIMDVTEGAILASVKKYSKVVLSPDYESNIEKECKKRIQEVEVKCGNIVAEKDKKIVERENNINSLNNTIASQKSQMSLLEQEIKRRDSEKKKGDLVQSVDRIKEPITALADYFRTKDSQPKGPEYGYKNYRLGIICCALSAIVLILCALTLFVAPKVSNKDDKASSKQVTELTNENQRLKEKIAQLKYVIAQFGQQPTPPPQQEPPIAVPIKSLQINIGGYSGSGSLSTDKTYTISVKEGNKQYSGPGQWSVTNATFTQGKPSDAQITIRPNGKGPVTLNFTAQNCTCEPRTIQVASAITTTAVTKPKIIIEPDVKEVEIEHEYIFSVSGYKGKGTWGLDGFSTTDDKSASKIKVKVIDTGKGATKATISYTPDGGGKEIKSYPIKKTK